jgi:SSS family solute:Na+ symporter
MLLLLREHAPVWLAGILGAGIMAAVMASDSQILALSTMFTEDFFAYYGGKERFGEKVQVMTGRIFVIGVTVVAYAIAMSTEEKIFDIATQFAFTGYAALSPLMIAAVFWKRSTKWGALASTLVVAAGIAAISYFFNAYEAPPPRTPPTVIWSIGDTPVISRTRSGVSILDGYLPVMPLALLSALAMVVGSLLSRPPSRETVARYFPEPGHLPQGGVPQRQGGVDAPGGVR